MSRATKETPLSWLEKVIVPLVVAVIAFVGVWFGSFLTAKQAREQAESGFQMSLEQQIFSKREDLISKAANIFGKSPGIQELFREYIERGIKGGGSKSAETMELIRQLADYRGEFEAVLYQLSASFGPQTVKACNDLGKEKGPWWSKSQEKQQAVLVAMVNERFHGLTKVKDKNGFKMLPPVIQSADDK